MKPDLRSTVGLCANCRNAVRIPHPRGGRDYWRCALADTDPRFERYPRLPVLRCTGYTAKESETRG